MTRTFIPLSRRCCTTQSTAATTWVTSTPPSALPTLTLRMRASGATPTTPSPFFFLSRRHAGVTCGDDPGQVGPVAVAVDVPRARRLALERQVGPVHHLAGAVEPGHEGDPRVDQRDRDALARDPPPAGVFPRPGVL